MTQESLFMIATASEADVLAYILGCRQEIELLSSPEYIRIYANTPERAARNADYITRHRVAIAKAEAELISRKAR